MIWSSYHLCILVLSGSFWLFIRDIYILNMGFSTSKYQFYSYCCSSNNKKIISWWGLPHPIVISITWLVMIQLSGQGGKWRFSAVCEMMEIMREDNKMWADQLAMKGVPAKLGFGNFAYVLSTIWISSIQIYKFHSPESPLLYIYKPVFKSPKRHKGTRERRRQIWDYPQVQEHNSQTCIRLWTDMWN